MRIKPSVSKIAAVVTEMQGHMIMWEAVFASMLAHTAGITREPQLFVDHLMANAEHMIRGGAQRSDARKEFEIAMGEFARLKSDLAEYLTQTIQMQGNA